jgi:hypothetical protein
MRELTRAEVQEALDRVLARPEFAERTPPALLQFISDVWSAFRSWLLSLLPTITPDAATGIAWVVIGVLALLAIWALVRLVGDRLHGPRDRALPVPRQRLSQRQPRAAAEWEALARSAAAERRFREAGLALYQAVLLRLEERGALRCQAGKTPGEYRREVRAHADVAGGFDRFIRAFLPLAFAAQEPDAHSFESLRDTASGLGIRA